VNQLLDHHYLTPDGRLIELEVDLSKGSPHELFACKWVAEHNIVARYPDDYLIDHGWVKFTHNGLWIGCFNKRQKKALEDAGLWSWSMEQDLCDADLV